MRYSVYCNYKYSAVKYRENHKNVTLIGAPNRSHTDNKIISDYLVHCNSKEINVSEKVEQFLQNSDRLLLTLIFTWNMGFSKAMQVPCKLLFTGRKSFRTFAERKTGSCMTTAL